MDCSTNKLNDSCNSLLESLDSGEESMFSPSRTLCDSTVSGDRKTCEVTRHNEASPSSLSALSTIQEESMEVDNSSSVTTAIVESSEKSKNVVESTESCDNSVTERKELVESSESNIEICAESSPNSVANSGEQRFKSDTADTTSSCISVDQGQNVLSCSTDSQESTLSYVDSSSVAYSLSKLADSSINSVNLSPGRPDSDNRTLANVVSSDSSISVPTSTESVAERTVAPSSSVDGEGHSGNSVLLCSSSCSSTEIKPDVSASTDSETVGVSVSTSQDISDIQVVNSSEEPENVRSANDTNSEKLHTSDSAPEISSSKLREYESELEEGEIIDSSEDEVENKEQNVDSSSSSSSNVSNNNSQESEPGKSEPAEHADSASSVVVSASDSVKENASNSEVDSTSSHSTATSIVSGHQGADSSVSCLLDTSSDFSMRRNSFDMPSCSSCHQLRSLPNRLDTSGVDSTTVGSSSQLQQEKKKTKVRFFLHLEF